MASLLILQNPLFPWPPHSMVSAVSPRQNRWYLLFIKASARTKAPPRQKMCFCYLCCHIGHTEVSPAISLCVAILGLYSLIQEIHNPLQTVDPLIEQSFLTLWMGWKLPVKTGKKLSLFRSIMHHLLLDTQYP